MEVKRKEQNLSIDWELMTVKDVDNILKNNEGYVDGDKKTLEIKTKEKQ